MLKISVWRPILIANRHFWLLLDRPESWIAQILNRPISWIARIGGFRILGDQGFWGIKDRANQDFELFKVSVKNFCFLFKNNTIRTLLHDIYHYNK